MEIFLNVNIKKERLSFILTDVKIGLDNKLLFWNSTRRRNKNKKTGISLFIIKMKQNFSLN